MNDRLTFSFPAGELVKARPTKAELEASALSWLSLAQRQVNGLEVWIDRPEGQEILREIKSKLAIIRGTLEEEEP